MDLGIIVDNLPRLLSGAWMTLQLTGLSALIGLALAVPVALARLSDNPLLSWPAFAYMFYFRGTPLLVQIFLIYYGSGQFVPQLRALGLWEFFREPYFCALLTLTLNTAAYTAEILRGAIRAVPLGEIEAARALGMSGSLRLRRIILPKAFRLALPAYTNEVIFLFQATSLVSIITIMDLTGVGRVLIAETFRTFEIWIVVGLCYLMMSYAILYGFRRLEYHLSGHLRAGPELEAEPVQARLAPKAGAPKPAPASALAIR
jgi:octopine/nopaline transport system permease protein/arginine/ornithine transport system permease protein